MVGEPATAELRLGGRLRRRRRSRPSSSAASRSAGPPTAGGSTGSTACARPCATPGAERVIIAGDGAPARAGPRDDPDRQVARRQGQPAARHVRRRRLVGRVRLPRRADAARRAPLRALAPGAGASSGRSTGPPRPACCSRSRRCWPSSRVAIRLELARAGAVPADPRRSRRAAVPDPQVPLDGASTRRRARPSCATSTRPTACSRSATTRGSRRRAASCAAATWTSCRSSINVLRGEMSLVGPRPLVVDEDLQIHGWHRRRLELTPGVTGPGRCSARPASRCAEMVAIDYLYVANWSLWGDIKVLLRTVPCVLGAPRRIADDAHSSSTAQSGGWRPITGSVPCRAVPRRSPAWSPSLLLVAARRTGAHRPTSASRGLGQRAITSAPSGRARPRQDGLTNWGEYRAGTNPRRRDSDRDGISDALEDRDRDRLVNAEEIAAGTDPRRATATATGFPTAARTATATGSPTPTSARPDTTWPSATATATASPTAATTPARSPRSRRPA